MKSREEALEWTKRFVQVDAPGRYGSESACEIRQIFELEDFAPSDPTGKLREQEKRMRDEAGR